MGSKITGVITFTQFGYDGALKISGNITGLPIMPTVQKHGLHVHQQTLTSVSDDNSGKTKILSREFLYVFFE